MAKALKTVRIDKIKVGETSFFSKGLSKIKITDVVINMEKDEETGEEKSVEEEEIICYELPIRSTGISDLIDTFNKDAPKPPSMKYLAKPDCPVGKEMKLNKNQWIQMPDFTDENYKSELESHNSDMGTAMIMKGLNVTFYDRDDNPIEDETEKIKKLKDMGFSGEHLTQIVEDITSLTKWSEDEKNDFFV